ncbi:hypothetical protein ASD04_07075 [Devosia sp. Root436]|uniref:hypothetical protein n=1 Tax=Devosia sp. Root436 TaxID=1736537 RepID=UPI0006FA2DD2|nr:hypothetical protein [Devosia sp. Root436]KQX40385.1 hypothetical protein ASD04_07075 [Devosia sp. Root436]
MSRISDPIHQSTKAAARRDADRLRKREARAKMKAERVPHASLVDYAVCQAVSFCLTNADKSAFRPDDAWTPINASALYAVALDILVVRFKKDPTRSEEALRAKLGPQARHAERGQIPSTNPRPGQPRYRMTAPPDMSAR